MGMRRPVHSQTENLVAIAAHLLNTSNSPDLACLDLPKFESRRDPKLSICEPSKGVAHNISTLYAGSARSWLMSRCSRGPAIYSSFGPERRHRRVCPPKAQLSHTWTGASGRQPARTWWLRTPGWGRSRHLKSKRCATYSACEVGGTVTGVDYLAIATALPPP